MSKIDWGQVRAERWVGPPTSLPEPGQIRGLVDFDTETSGLHPDDGARVSVVSVAWVEWQGDEPVIRYVAWPFAQGKQGKPEDDGVRDLFSGGEDGEGDVNLDKREWEALVEWLARAGCGLSGHNVKFDVPMVRAGVDGLREGTIGWTGPDLTERVLWDTQVAAKELWPLLPTGLKGPGSVSHRLFGHEDTEKQALKAHLGPQTNPRYDLVPWGTMEPYAEVDALLTCRVRHMEWQAIERGEVAHGGAAGGHWVRREFAVLRVLADMERRGIPYDAAGSQHAAAEVRVRMHETEQKMGLPISKAKDYWFGRDAEGKPVKVVDLQGKVRQGRGMDPYDVTPAKREPKLTAEVVEDMVRDGIAGAVDYQQFKKLETANKMWYVPYAAGVGPDGRLRTVFRQVASGFEKEGGTASGRFSAERVNLQAIPHDYRLGGEDGALHGIPTPRQLIGQAARRLDGWELWEFDLAQAELRVAAMWAACQTMLDLIESGADLHGVTATALFGLKKGDPKWGETRQVAKRGNFSLIFGSGWLTFQRMVKKETGIRLSNHEAQRIVAEWNALYPEFRQAIDRHSKKIEWAPAGAKGMPLANGRVRWFKAFEDTHKAFNQRVQASLAELGKDWMVATNRLGHEWGLDERGRAAGVGPGGLLLTIHDSQVWLLPGMDAEGCAEQIREEGLKVWRRLFPSVSGGVDAKQWDAA
jgi:DNA polymerase I-like protein with 3'-5' exonuclease and polymerase domains